MTTDADRETALQRIRDRYGHYEASGYERKWTVDSAGARAATRERDRWLLSSITPLAGSVVLDLGCGEGGLAHILATAGERPERYVGVDIRPEVLAEAPRDLPWATFVEASADRLPFDVATVDIVVAMTMFSSILDDWLRVAVAREVARILRPGGRLVVYDLRYRSPGNPGVRPLTRSDLRQLFPDWIIRVRPITLLPPLTRLRLVGSTAYRVLVAIPFLRSHIGAVLIKP